MSETGPHPIPECLTGVLNPVGMFRKEIVSFLEQDAPVSPREPFENVHEQDLGDVACYG